MKWTMEREPSGNPLTDLHTESFATVSHLYDGQDPRQKETYEVRANAIVPRFTVEHRKSLVNALRPYMSRIGANDLSMQQLERLQLENCVAVVTGQQAGLFTGPLYALYKALSAIGLARRLETDLKRPVVPVFWVASEDHDWSEVNHAYLLNEQDEVRRVQLRAEVSQHQMIYHTRLRKEDVKDTIRALQDIVPDGIGKSDMIRFLMDSFSEGLSMADWFAKVLVRLVRAHGLVLIDPCLPEIRALARPVWQHTLRQRFELQENLSIVYDEVSRAGFSPEVVRDDKNSTLFYVVEDKRYVLELSGSTSLKVRGVGIEMSVDEWLKIAEREPEKFSSNVLLRPVVQDYLLPTLAYVGGPSEIAYYPLARGVFKTHGLTLPPLVLRQRMTLYPPTVVRNMEKWSLTVQHLKQPPSLVGRFLDDNGIANYEVDAQECLQRLNAVWQAWADKHAELGPQVHSIASSQMRREVENMQRVLAKTKRLFEQKHDAEVRQLRHIERWIWTDGHLQERRLCPMNLWARCGGDWFDSLPLYDNYEMPGPVYHVQL